MKVCKVHEDAVIPSKTRGNIGFDLATVEGFYLKVGEKHTFKTGLKIEIPEGFGALIRDRSGLGAKHGIHVLAGVIDSSYRGEWMVAVVNLGDKDYQVAVGDRIAQGIIVDDFDIQFEEVSEEELTETDRGDKGFGSSGK